jgi:hypothetical protein
MSWRLVPTLPPPRGCEDERIVTSRERRHPRGSRCASRLRTRGVEIPRLRVNPARLPGLVNAAGGKAFADFLLAPGTQEIISAFGRQEYGEPLFVAGAGKREEDLGL